MYQSDPSGETPELNEDHDCDVTDDSMGPFAMVPIWFFEFAAANGLTLADRSVYTALRSYANPAGENGRARAKTIAARAGCAMETTRNSIQKLRRLGLLRTTPRYREDGGLAGFRYHLALRPPAPQPVDNSRDEPDISPPPASRRAGGVHSPVEGGGPLTSGGGGPLTSGPKEQTNNEQTKEKNNPPNPPSKLGGPPPNPPAARGGACSRHPKTPATNCRGCGTNPRGARPPAEPEKAAVSLPWCQECFSDDYRYQVDEEQRPVRKCPRCHPASVLAEK